MKSINLKRDVFGSVDDVITRATAALQADGFGILTRIYFHSKMKEKLGKELPTTVVLGACNPPMAFEAYQRNPDFLSLIPCNVMVCDVGMGKVSVQIAKPTSMMEVLDNAELSALAKTADAMLERALERI